MRKSLLAVMALGLCIAGCVTSPRDAFVKNQRTYEHQLHERYPEGVARDIIIGRHGKPQETLAPLPEHPPDSFLKACLDNLSIRGLHPSRCDVYSVLRSDASAVFGATGLYRDYLFYGGESDLIAAFRRFVD
jgi:hypothetical protein